MNRTSSEMSSHLVIKPPEELDKEEFLKSSIAFFGQNQKHSSLSPVGQSGPFQTAAPMAEKANNRYSNSPSMKTNNFPSIVIKNNSKSIDKPCLKMIINSKYEHPKLPLDIGPQVKKVTLDSVHSINSIA